MKILLGNSKASQTDQGYSEDERKPKKPKKKN
jgi:hypothetical protein